MINIRNLVRINQQAQSNKKTDNGNKKLQIPPQLLVGGLLVLTILSMVLWSEHWSHFPYDQLRVGPRLSPPSKIHWFGTDGFGRDVWSRLVIGSRYTLGMAFTASLISMLPGTFLGLIAGYRGGWLDRILSRFIDLLLSLPGLLLAIILIARLGPSMLTTAIALGVTGIPAFYRVIRTETITLSMAPFVEASTLAGARTFRILFRHICPHLYPDLIVLGSLRIGTFMLAGSGLSFIGLGAQSPTPEWGVLLSEGKQFMNTAWWLWVFPAAAIMLAVFSFNLFGDGLRDWVDERSR